MKKFLGIFLVLAGCDTTQNVEDSEHIVFVSVAETWREVCKDRYNIYDYPLDGERDILQAECRRRFADGEEVLELPDVLGL